METKIIQKIRNNTRSLVLLRHGDIYEVSLKDGVESLQYWKFSDLKLALIKLNELTEVFE